MDNVKDINRLNRKEIILCVIAFLFMLIFGVISLNNYGIHIDDFIQAKYGELVSLKLVTPHNNDYLSLSNLRYYGPIYEVLLHIGISFFGIARESIEYFYMRKFITYLTFLVGCLFFYLLMRRYFKLFPSFFSTFLLFLIPTFFGYAQVTTKEIPLISFTIIAFYFLDKYIDNTNRVNLLWHTLFLSLAIAIRPSALMYVPITVLFVLVSEAKAYSDSHTSLKKRIIYLTTNIFLAFVIFTIIHLAFDPYLRDNPLQKYSARLEFMSTFDNGGSIMINGEVMRVADTKTKDMFIYGLRKIPEVFLLFSFIGFIVGVLKMLKIPLKKIFLKNSLFVYGVLWLFLPLIAIFVKETKFYNFRHLLIFLPPLGIFVAYALNFVFNNKTWRLCLIIIVIIASIQQVFTLYRLFPYEITYFNNISGGMKTNSTLYSNYPEGLAEAEAIKKLCKKDSPITLAGPFVNLYLPYYCSNAKYTDNYENAEYIVTYDFYEKLMPIPETATYIDSIQREDASILNIYKNK